MKQDIEKLRKKYIDNPPEGMTSGDIRHMSGDELLDMDYFLNEDDLLMTRLAWKVFISSKACRLIVILRQEFIRHLFGKLLFLLYL